MDDNRFVKFTESKIGDVLRRPVLVTSIKEAIDKKDNTYVRLTLRDGCSDITPNMFSMDKRTLENIGVVEGCIADATITVSEYGGTKNFRVDKITPTADRSISVDDFIKTPPVPADVMFDEIVELLRSSADDIGGTATPLAELAISILNDKAERFKTSSAAISMHHNFKGGLLYHTYRMVKTADAVCNIYTGLDRELLICGTALHDIGKIWEYSTTSFGEAEFTSNGILFGHLYLGASLIRQYSEKGSYNREKVQLLTHMILSHHGTMEFGAVKPPAFAEAFALHYIDNLDAKIGTCENYYDTLEQGGLTDKKPFGLDNRIYKPKL